LSGKSKSENDEEDDMEKEGDPELRELLAASDKEEEDEIIQPTKN
jgi:hypothetical protein